MGDDSVQEASAEALPGLLMCLYDGLKNNQVDLATVKQLMLAIFEKVSNQMGLEDSPECLSAFAICIEKVLKVDINLTKQCSTPDYNKAVTETLLSCLKESAERMTSRTKSMEKCDEEDMDRLNEENEQEAQLSTHIADTVGAFVAVYKDQ